MIALTVGTVLALLALAYVLAPLFSDAVPARVELRDPGIASESSNAVSTLREIEFDRATGKLSDSDYASLKTSYTSLALEAMRAESAKGDEDASLSGVVGTVPAKACCPVCGPRPESDALYCSSCGRHLGGPCAQCGATIDQPGARFCAGCGHAVAA
jgi:hypothetical protein